MQLKREQGVLLMDFTKKMVCKVIVFIVFVGAVITSCVMEFQNTPISFVDTLCIIAAILAFLIVCIVDKNIFVRKVIIGGDGIIFVYLIGQRTIPWTDVYSYFFRDISYAAPGPVSSCFVVKYGPKRKKLKSQAMPIKQKEKYADLICDTCTTYKISVQGK